MPTVDEEKRLVEQRAVTTDDYHDTCRKQLTHLVQFKDGLGVEPYGFCINKAKPAHVCPYNNFDEHDKSLCTCCESCTTTCAAASGAY